MLARSSPWMAVLCWTNGLLAGADAVMLLATGDAMFGWLLVLALCAGVLAWMGGEKR